MYALRAFRYRPRNIKPIEFQFSKTFYSKSNFTSKSKLKIALAGGSVLASSMSGKFYSNLSENSDRNVIEIQHSGRIQDSSESAKKSIESTRSIHNIADDPYKAIEDAIKDKPRFMVDSDKIKIIYEPSDFYSKLKQVISEAKERVYLSTLYIGSSEKELIETISIALDNNKSLKVTILEDCLRGTRPERGETGLTSSAAEISRLVEKHGADRVSIFLYHTPKLAGIKKRIYPERINETVGVQHIKAYICDSNVIMTGANLNKDYFTNRQDRYFQFEEAPQVADYLVELIDGISRFSYRLVLNQAHSDTFNANDRFSLVLNDKDCPDPVKRPRKFKKYAYQIMINFIEKWNKNTASTNIFTMENGSGVGVGVGVGAGAGIQRSQTDDYPMQKLQTRSESSKEYTGDYTFVVPTIQMAPLGIHQDQKYIQKLFRAIKEYSLQLAKHDKPSTICKTEVTSAYFNFARIHIDAILACKSTFNFLVASPQACGFFGAKGVSRHIPNTYSLFELEFLKHLSRVNRSDAVKIREYSRDGWSYHGKGVWCYFDQETPVMTIIGSSNFGQRSYSRDLEAQLTIVSTNPDFRNRLHDEIENLKKHSYPVDEKVLEQDKSRDCPTWIRVFRRVIQDKM